jgi:hypothetical protein
MAGPYDHYIGKLWPGAYGWLPLDEAGTPIGPAHPNPPTEGSEQPACHVLANPKIPLGDEDALITSTGAPITDHMTSNVDKRADYDQMYKSAPKPTGFDESDSRENTIRHRSDR